MGRPRVNQRAVKSEKSSAKKDELPAKANGFHNDPPKRGRKRAQEDKVESPHPKKAKLIELPAPQITDGLALTVGTGDIGQLGLGPNTEERTRPGVVPDMLNVIEIAAGGLHSLCLTNDGKVYSWGCNDEHGLGRVTEVEEDNFTPGEVSLPGSAVQISAGDCHSAALISDGRVFAWGSFRDNSGPLGFLQEGHMQKTPVQLMEGTLFKKITSGNNHLAMLTQAGIVYTCGCGESGQLGRIAPYFASRDSRNRKGTETQLQPMQVKVNKKGKVLFDNVWAGGMVTFLRAAETGDIYGFGLNNYCQLGDVNTNMKFRPDALAAFKGKQWKHISPGQHHSVALDEDGIAYVMGRHEYGRLGLGEEKKDAQTPTPLTSLEAKAVHVAAGECVSFVVLENGNAYGFGMGTNNQLAQGTEDDMWVPTLLTGKQLADRKVMSVQAGGQHTMILATPKS